MIENFTIYGERCSGTNFLEEVMLTNFNINVTWEYGWKHFFGFYNFKKTEDEDKTLFIGIVRHPICWIESFFNNQHHIPNGPINIDKFLLDEIYSIDNGNIIKEDLNYITCKKYKNIFELRFLKNYYLINTMPNNVKNYILINYENLRDNYEVVLDNIKNKFGLVQKFPIYKNISYYKKEKDTKYEKKKNTLPIKYQLLSFRRLNKIQEAKLGYKLEFKPVNM
jgi:hypothetical protein